MKITCTKEEFFRMLEMCNENRHGLGGCQGCMIGEIIENDDIPCSERFVAICEITKVKEDDY